MARTQRPGMSGLIAAFGVKSGPHMLTSSSSLHDPLANKLARMAWAMMAKGERYRQPVALAA